MGTTLTNGIYLPNEGEKNCYAGLKTNWETLDQKIADIAALQQAVAGALHREIVASLPTTDIDPNTIYMILSGTSATENVYDEFMYVNNAWELIGTSATDLTNYYTKGDVDGLLLLKANASDLTSHTGDTTIHVTASDKSKWDTVALIKQLRLVNTQVGSSTTIAFANIDDTNGIKVGDKCMDLDAKMFEITAVDTTNQTVTVGSALIDLALDANVVHTSGNETVGGNKTFIGTNEILRLSGDHKLKITDTRVTPLDPIGSITSNITWQDSTGRLLGTVANVYDNSGNSIMQLYARSFNANDEYESHRLRIISNKGGNSYADVDVNFLPSADNRISLGSSTLRWNGVYATNYYYGSNNVEFSTKFVTTDTDQTVSGQKVFSDINAISSSAEIGVSGGNNSFKILDKNKNTILRLDGGTYSSGMAYSYWLVNNGSDAFNGVTLYQASANSAQLRPYASTLSLQLGSSSRSFSDCYTSKINGVEPSSLSLPSDNSSNVVDISSYITYFDGTLNRYVPPANGWIGIYVNNCTEIYMKIDTLWGKNVCRSDAGKLVLLMPVPKGKNVDIQIFATGTLRYARFIPCSGNF